MFKFRLFDLLSATWYLEVAQDEADKIKDIGQPTKIGETDREFYQEVVDRMKRLCEQFELESTLDQIYRINDTLEFGSLYGAYSTVTSQVQQVWECLKTDLDKRVFMFMPRDHCKYYE